MDPPLQARLGARNGPSETSTQTDLDLTKSLLAKANAGRFETLPALLGVLDDIAREQRDLDDLAREQRELDAHDLTHAHARIDEHLGPQQMVYVVVGDTSTQLPCIREFGLGEPVVLRP